MPTSRDQAMLVRAATLYYLEGKSQAEIAKEIGVSRSNVSRVLATARAQGIVDIRINDPFGRATELERELIERFHLRDCRVAPNGGPNTGLSRVGVLGAEWLMDNLPDRGGIALSWGSNVQAVVDAIPDDPIHGSLEILPLVGGLSIVDSARDGNVLVRSLATKLGAQHKPLYAPAVVESLETRDAFLREPSINSVLKAATQAKIALVGIGRVGEGASSAILESMKLNAGSLRVFRESGAVGDCCTRFFDLEGRAVESEANDRVIGIDLAGLRMIPTVIGVVVGANKIEGTFGALAGNLIDVLVVDESLARALIEFSKNPIF